MSGAKHFLKIDASSGYWQIKVHRESSNLLSFGKTIGRFRFKGLLYGLLSASKVFQKTFSSIISDIESSANSQDNIVIWGKTLPEHDNLLRKVLLKVRESGLKLNKNKCQFRKEAIVFLRHIISSEGIRVNTSKTDAITKMPVPQSLTELQSFPGMVNYLGKFISNFAEVTPALRVLLKKDVVFNLQKPKLDAIENFDCASSYFKNFRSKLTYKIKK